MSKAAVPAIGTAALLVLLGLVGCKSKPVPPVAVLARVGEKFLSDEEVKAWESYLPNDKLTPESRANFIRNWVEKELLVSAALEKGLDDDPWVESRIDELHRELLTSRLLELDASSHLPPTTKEVLEYFNQHSNEFIWKNLHLEVVYWHSPEKPPLDKLRAGMTQNRPSPLFPSEVSSIDSGRFDIDDPETVDPIVWRHFAWMAVGQLGFPTAIRGSYWLFRVERRDEPGTPQRLEDVVDEITSRLIEIARLNHRNELVRYYADQYGKAGRLQWIESIPDSLDISTEEKDSDRKQ
jgi:hypothetical protein